ncbi:WcaI family glycosyltransferase [Demequina sp. NBRC 110056]|uniref:WcaI family glycosyltransferase n=1 Tax=Demequina sp. NBRC 110056 TaxID=1570345 RepID=UPI00117E4423|nr:WcaI family glycosyltransferase [Demequina sp. NBRC 110056]
MSAQRLTVVGINYAPEISGIPPYTTALAEHCADAGMGVTVVTAFPHYPQWKRYADYSGLTMTEEISGVQVRRRWHYIPASPRGLKRLVSELTFGVTSTLARWKSPDTVVVVSPALFGATISMARAALRRGRTAVWVQDLYSQGMQETGEGSGAVVRIAGALEGWTLRRADAVVAIHDAMASRMVESLGVDRERITVIPNWTHIRASTATRSEAREALGWDPDAFIALHAGNMGSKQGLDNIVEAARLADARAGSVEFVMLGDGGERSRLEAASAGMTSIRFVDPLPGDSFPLALAAADVLLVNELPGIREMAAPSKLTSYFAAGRPVAAAVSADGIVSQIMAKAGAGPVVTNEEPHALLEALETLRNDEGARTAFGAAAREYWRSNLSADSALAAWQNVISNADRNAPAAHQEP